MVKLSDPARNLPLGARSNRQIVARIQAQLAKLNKSPRGASIEAGLSPDAIRNFIRWEEVVPRLDTIEALATVLELAPEELAFGIKRGAEGPRPKVLGAVAAGLWLDTDGFDQREYPDFPLPIDGRYPPAAQYGLVVQGTSVNRVAQPGEILQCVDIHLAEISPVSGDLVIIERRREQLAQREVTAKRFHVRGKKYELAPDSSDDRWQTPVIFDPTSPTDDEEIVIVALVIGVYKPLKGGGL